MFPRLVLASNNQGKLKEFSALLAPLGIDEVVAQGALNVPEAEEPYLTFVENALTKARHASRLTGLPALADDSGLCVCCLGGAPGVLSARYAGEPKFDTRNNEKLLAEMVDQADRRAYYYCVLVLVRSADDPQPLIADGMWMGEILPEPRGASGFGYDPIFLDVASGQSAAELDFSAKNTISHRAKALQQLVIQLKQRG